MIAGQSVGIEPKARQSVRHSDLLNPQELAELLVQAP